MKTKILLTLTFLFLTFFAFSQIELKGIQIGEKNTYSDDMDLAGITFNLQTVNDEDGICWGVYSDVIELTDEKLNDLILALNSYYDIKLRLYYLSNDKSETMIRDAIGKGNDKCVVKIWSTETDAVKPNQMVKLEIFNKNIYPNLIINREVEL